MNLDFSLLSRDRIPILIRDQPLRKWQSLHHMPMVVWKWLLWWGPHGPDVGKVCWRASKKGFLSLLRWKHGRRVHLLSWTYLTIMLRSLAAILWSAPGSHLAMSLREEPQSRVLQRARAGSLLCHICIHPTSGLLVTWDNVFPYCLNRFQLKLLFLAAKGHLTPAGGSYVQPALWPNAGLTTGCYDLLSQVVRSY